MYFAILLALLTPCLTVPPIRHKSDTNSYKISVTSIESLYILSDLLLSDLLEEVDPGKCVIDKANLKLICHRMSNSGLITVLEADDYVVELDADDVKKVTTTSTSKSTRKRRDVPWNLDRLNQMKLDLDGSFMDDTDVDVYILGSGIAQNHAEFGNRVHTTSFTDGDGTDCDGSGTMYASLVGGASMGVARKAQLHSVQVISCEDKAITSYAFTKGVDYVTDSIAKSMRKSVVLVGFTRDTKEEEWNKQLIRLSEVAQTGGVMVVVAAGDSETDELDACKSSPASAKGESAISGVITVGAIDNDDNIISNIGECVDIFAPGYEVMAADSSAPTAEKTCTGSLCAAALAAGVAAAHLRENNKISLETQKAMLINGATVTELGLPEHNGKYTRTLLMAQTPRRVLYYTCGYYRNPALPECTVYTAQCNMNKVNTFDEVGDGHVYEQADKDCGFEVFTNEDSSLVVTSSHYESTLGSYLISMSGKQIELLPGPVVKVHDMDISDQITNTDGEKQIYLDEGVVTISHNVRKEDDNDYRHPSIVVQLIEHQMQLTYDCNSMLVIKLLSIAKYSGKTAGLCGFYDGIGRNDYKMKDGTQLEKYSEEFHKSWQLKTCDVEKDRDDPECKIEAEAVCSRKFSEADSACFVNENMYREKEACIAEMSACCGCNQKATGWEDLCCKDSYFGKLEERKKGCFVCDTPHCKNETVHEDCTADTTKSSYDYMETRSYKPRDCCHSIDRGDVQECMAPKSAALMWNVTMPVCTIKKCQAPVLPNGYTYVSPAKDEYECGERVTVQCKKCYKVVPTTLTCTSTCDDNYDNNAGWDKEVPECVEKDCGDPGLPNIDNNKGLLGPFSWIVGNKETMCDDRIKFQCDVCYEMEGKDTITCTENEQWFDKNPSCKLRSCDIISLTDHLLVDVENNNCNDTVNYKCDHKCWKLHGKKSRTCEVGTDLSIDWSAEQPECKIKHCPPLTEDDFGGEGSYYYINEEGVETKVDLTGLDTTYTTVNECDASVKAVCDQCHYLCGSEYRGCIVDGSKDEPKWNGTRPTCQKKQCRAIVNDPNETHAKQVIPLPEDGTKYWCGDDVKMECDKCYEFASGDETRTCIDMSIYETYNDVAAFDGTQFMCKIKNCDALPVPANGTIVLPSTTECGKTVDFKCDKCYRTIGDTRLECDEDEAGQQGWSGSPPTCDLWKCPARTEPANAKFTNYSDNCGKGIEYECEDCYYMKGSKESKCLEGGRNDKGELEVDGKWDVEAPTCHKYVCDKQKAPGNGSIETNEYECSQSTVFSCKECFTMIGNKTTTCQAGDKWKESKATWSNEAPTCQMKTCKAPVIPDNTLIVEKKEQYNCGETIVVQCFDCYELTAKTVLRCNGDNNWNGTVPECTIKSCEMPPLPEIDHKIHTVDIITGNPIIYGDYTLKPPDLICNKTVTYECDKCYHLKGDDTIRCHDDKSWDDVPSCQLKKCVTPVMTDHLMINYTSSKIEDTYYCRDRVDYACDDECYALHGKGSQTCDSERGVEEATWSDEQSVCKIKTCPAIEDIEHGTIDEKDVKCGRKITYQCHPCYRLVGEAVRECNSSSQWTTPPPICEPVCCPPLPITTEEAYYEDGKDLNYTTYNYTYHEEPIDGCGKDHVCQEVDVTCDDCWEYKEGDEILPSPPSRKCEHPDSGEGLGKWTNEDKVCTRKTCPQRIPSAFHHANYTKYEYMVDAVNCHDKVKWECKFCHENKKGTEMEQSCLSTKKWSDDIPTCELKECGDWPVIEHCHFEPKPYTCGINTKLSCDSCYCTENCEDPTDTDIVTIQCKDDHEWKWRNKEPKITIKTCPAPPEIVNAVSATDGPEGEVYTCGRSIRYHCEECFKMEKERECDCAELTCVGTGGDSCCTGSWQGEQPKCIPIMCPVLPTPQHANPVINKNGCKMTTKFECDEGYELVDGDLERTCTTSETWTGKAPVCRIKNCTALTDPANGKISSYDHSYGDAVEFTCNDCYEFPGNFTDDSFQNHTTHYARYNFLLCEATGNWNGSVPACRKKSCGHPGVINNGRIIGTNFSCSDTIGYECNEGYEKESGSDARKCGTDKKWSGTETVCREVDCGEPKKTDNSIISVSETTYKHRATYTCKNCYNTSTETDLTCEATGLWSHPAPTCDRIQCDPQIQPTNGLIRYLNRNLEDNDCNQRAYFTCIEGYRIQGDSVTTCRDNGQWSKYKHPTCERQCCPGEKLDHGEINKLDGGICYQDRVEYECEDCYALVDGDSKRTCGPHHSWLGDRPRCKQRECNIQFEIENGSHFGSNKCSETRSFNCNPGYTKKGADELTCLSNGRWSGEKPTCEPIKCDCSDLDIKGGNKTITHSPLTPSQCGPQSVVFYWCNDGYEMKGEDNMMICNNDGMWSVDKPKCIIDKCQEPVKPANGEVEFNHVKEGGRATYTCNTCFKSDGYTVADCHDGEWSNPPVTCTEVTCVRPAVPMFAVPMIDSKPSYSCGETVTYNCIENHKLHGDAVRKCQDDGRWTSTVPTCSNLTCPALDRPKHGTIQPYQDDKMIFTCNKGYQLYGDYVRECFKGQWSGVDVSCKIQNCGDPGKPMYGKRIGDSFEYTDIVEFTCDYGYSLRGNADRKCQHDGTWSGIQPECVCKQCNTLPDILNGNIRSTEANTWKSSVAYYCDEGYELTGGNETRTCEASGEWSGVAPTCERVRCGNPPRPDGAEFVKTVLEAKYQDSVKLHCKNSTYTGVCNEEGQWSFTDNIDKKCSCTLVWKEVTEIKITVTPGKCVRGICFKEYITEKEVKVWKEVCE